MAEPSCSTSQVVPKNKFFSKEMLPCKLIFFFGDASAGSLTPFISLFYVSSGINVANLGLINAIEDCFVLIIGPLWGLLLDSAKQRQFVSMILWFGATICVCAKPWIIKAVAKVERNSTHTNHTQISYTVSEYNTLGNDSTKVLNPNELFFTVLGLGVFTSIFYVGLMVLMEGAVVNIVNTRKTKPCYGQQKVFGPVGFAIGSLIAGVAIDHYKSKSNSPYLAGFYVYIPFTLICAPLYYIITKQAKWDAGKEDVNKISIRKHLISVLKSSDHIMFLMSVIVSGFLYSVYAGFYSLFINDELTTSKTMIALIMNTAVLSELSIYPFSSKIIKFCGGPMACVFFGILSYVPRFILFSFCKRAWQLIPCQLFHGIGLSLAWTAMVEYNFTIFPREVSTTALAFLMNLHFVASDIVTSIVGGQLYHAYGGRKLFRGAACISAGWCLVMMLYFAVIKRLKAKRYIMMVEEDVSNASEEVDADVEHENIGERLLS